MLRRTLAVLTCLSLLFAGSVSAATPPRDVVVPSADLSSSDLAARFPVSINDQPVHVRTWSGDDWVERFDLATPDGAAAMEAVEALLVAAGANLADLSVATATVEYRPENFAAISAIRIPSANMGLLTDEVIGVAIGPIEPLLGWGVRGGRLVSQVRDASIPGEYPITFYPIEDTAWVVQADRPVVDDIVVALPALDPPATTATTTPTGALSEARTLHTATSLPDGRVLVVGGVEARMRRGSVEKPDDPRMSRRLASAEVWSPETGVFTAAGTLAVDRAGHTATRLEDGSVLIVGGSRSEGSAVVHAAEIWHPSTATFSVTGTPLEERFDHAAALLLDERVLISGGIGPKGQPVDTAEIWDPATGQFEAIAPMNLKRARHAAIRLADGRVALVGTFIDRDPGAARVEVWDPETETFDVAGELMDWRWSMEAALLGDGHIFVVGGISETPDGEVWDPRTGASYLAVPGLSERVGHTATALPDGRVLVIGGTAGGRGYWGITTIPDAEVFAAVSGPDPAGRLLEARMEHTASVLPDGRVLVVGGVGNELENRNGMIVAPALASAEIWSPE